jgi:polyisoprenoid-binding protein YceI
MKTRFLTGAALLGLLLAPALATAAEYTIDSAKAHAFVQFRIKHLGYSWILGRFDDFSGSFSYDESNPAASSTQVIIKTASIDTNYAERDKHLRSSDFLDVEKYPEARFVSTSYKESADGTAVLKGELSLHGVTRPVTIDVKPVGHGPDPWGGYRRGFEGSATLKLADFNIKYDLGPASREVELFLSVEGIRK